MMPLRISVKKINNTEATLINIASFYHKTKKKFTIFLFFLAKKEKSCIIERYAQSILVGGKNL